MPGSAWGLFLVVPRVGENAPSAKHELQPSKSSPWPLCHLLRSHLITNENVQKTLNSKLLAGTVSNSIQDDLKNLNSSHKKGPLAESQTLMGSNRIMGTGCAQDFRKDTPPKVALKRQKV